MQMKHAELIERASMQLSSGDGDVVARSYSGRGMMGRETHAVVGRLGAIVQSIAFVAAELAEPGKEAELEAFIEDMDVTWDNMGKSDLVVY